MQTTQQWLATVNAFVEDTCVVFTVAYLLSRARFIQNSSTDRERLISGVVLGLVASSEVVFSTMRAPYMTHALVVCLAILLGGWMTAGPVVAVVVLVAAIFDSPGIAAQDGALLLMMGLGMTALKRWLPKHRQPVTAGLSGAASQALAMLVLGRLDALLQPWHRIPLWLGSIPANGFGLALVMLVFQDSEIRARSERNRLEAEHFKTLLVSADLAALRARIHPHFLFNTLTAIASLCGLDPVRAEESVLKLGRMMRRTIEVEPTSTTMLSAELDYVRSYIDIQSLRFGKRIKARLQIDPEVLSVNLPAFALQTLVENAYQHGLSGSSVPGVVTVTARTMGKRNGVLLAVGDNGIGIKGDKRPRTSDSNEPPRHGLEIVDRQLRLLYGERFRVRFFSKVGEGTVVAFKVPRAAL